MTVFSYNSCILILAGTFLIGCTNQGYKVQGKLYRTNIEYILDYANDIKQLKNDKLLKEYQDAKYEYLKNSNNVNALKFSLVLIHLNHEYHNKSQAINILESLDAQEKSGPTKNLAVLLKELILEIQKTETLYNITNRKLSDLIEEKRNQDTIQEITDKKLKNLLKENRKITTQYKEVRQKVDEKEQVIEKLQKKIEELKAIERSLNERKNPRAPTT